MLDPSYRGTEIEAMARRLPCRLRWHSGYRVGVEVLEEHPDYRGAEIVDAAIELAVDGVLTPRIIGVARAAGDFDLQTIKRVWHSLARFGRRDPTLVLGEDDPGAPDVLHLRSAHREFAEEVTPAGHVHAIDPNEAPDPAVVFHSARGVGGRLLAIGALRALDDAHGELKSMHTAPARSWIGDRAVDARPPARRGASGRHAAGQPRDRHHGTRSHRLGRCTGAAGFVECAPFGEYTDNEHSVCMTLAF